MLEVRDLTVRYGDITVADGISFGVDERQWLMIAGPNGAGKSTTVSAIAQTAPYSGSVTFDGTDVKKFKAYQLAKNIGVLAQKNYVGYSFTVEQVVRLGRYPYSHGIFSPRCGDDDEMVQRAAEMAGIDNILNQSVLTLSGGELQRTFLAQVFAQDPHLLILDEPANHLDLVYKKQIYELIDGWVRESGRAVISVEHDLSLAKAYGTHALLLDKGKVVSFGDKAHVLSDENLNRVYKMDVSGWMKKLLENWQ